MDQETIAAPQASPSSAASEQIACSDGWRLSLSVLLPEGEPRGVVIAGHAMMVDRRTLAGRRGGPGLVEELVAHGLAVVWPDLRGHGASGPHASRGGLWTFDDLVEQDTPALVEFARERFPGLPVFAVGHSLFAHVALAHLARHPETPIAGLVLLASNIWVRSFEPSASRWWRKRALLEAALAACIPLGYLPARRLRIGNSDEPLAYFRQFVGWARSDEWNALDGYSYRAALGRVRPPVLAIAGTGDLREAHPVCTSRFVADVPRHRHLVAGKQLPAGAPSEKPGVPDVPLDFDPGHMELVTDARSRPVWARAAQFFVELSDQSAQLKEAQRTR